MTEFDVPVKRVERGYVTIDVESRSDARDAALDATEDDVTWGINKGGVTPDREMPIRVISDDTTASADSSDDAEGRGSDA